MKVMPKIVLQGLILVGVEICPKLWVKVKAQAFIGQGLFLGLSL
jgi:hypothetical protein